MMGAYAKGTVDYINMMLESVNTTAEELDICYEMEYNLFAGNYITEAEHGQLRGRIRDALNNAHKAISTQQD